MIGAADERARSEALLSHWLGSGANLCGQSSVRESAAVLTHARVYLGHDSGPMHLAAAVGNRVLSFSACGICPVNGFRTVPSTVCCTTTFHVKGAGSTCVSTAVRLV